MNAIAEAIKKAARRGEELYLKLCTVDSVDRTARTIDCSPIDDGAKMESVDLQALQGRIGGVVAFPKVGSEVIVGYLDRDNAVVLLMTQTDRIEIDCDEIIINGGDNAGVVKVDKMVDWMNNVYQDMQTLKSLLSTTTVAGNGAPLGILFSPKVKIPAASQFADEKLKH